MKRNDLIKLKVQEFCADIAQNRLWVQAAGGNVSWKTDTEIWIKASGTWLADAQNKSIFVPVDRALLDDALARGDYSFTPHALDGYTLRPSIETMLHALMPQKIVVHLHLVDAVARLVRRESDNEISYALGDYFSWLLVDYHKPGADLAKAIHARMASNPEIQVVLLKNHGVIIGADTIEEVHKVLSYLSERLKVMPRKYEFISSVLLLNTQLSPSIVSGYEPCTNEYLNRLVFEPDLYQRLKDSWSICPDHVVFLGATAACVDDLAELNLCLDAFDLDVPFIFIKDHGILQILGVQQTKLAQLIFYLDVILRQPIGNVMKCLEPVDVYSLLNWEAEIFRMNNNR